MDWHFAFSVYHTYTTHRDIGEIEAEHREKT